MQHTERGRAREGEARINNACSFYHLPSAEIFETVSLSLPLSLGSLSGKLIRHSHKFTRSLIDTLPITAARKRQFRQQERNKKKKINQISRAKTY